MSAKTQARLIFLAMFLAMFVSGALAGRLGSLLGWPMLVYRNALSVAGSYLSFLAMMGCYLRVVRAKPAFLSRAAFERIDGGRGGKSGWFDLGSSFVDFDALLVLLAVLALVLMIGIWVGVEGPALLLDEASAAAIAAGLAGNTVFLPDGSWLGRVIRRTAWPALIYLILSTIVMAYADVHCPGQPSFSSVVKVCVMAGHGR